MRVRLRNRIALVVCILFIVSSLAGLVIAQTSQEAKKTLVQTSTQSQSSYQKMVQSEACTQQMAANKYTYQIKNQNKTSNKKMTQSRGSDNFTRGNSCVQDMQFWL